jgi:hypothetical protein
MWRVQQVLAGAGAARADDLILQRLTGSWRG